MLSIEDGLVNDVVLSIYRAPDGALWFGTDGGGVSRYDEEGVKNLTAKDGLTYNDARVIYRAKDGVLWFGTQGGGVFRYDGKEFKNFTTKDGLAHNNVWVIHPLPDGTLCFGTGWGGSGGVSRYDGKNFEDFTVKIGLPRTSILAVHGALDGTMWFGTGYRGAFQYDGKKLVNFLADKIDIWAGKIVYAIHQAPDGAIWFGTQGNGVFRYDGKEFKNFTEADGLADNWVWSIHVDPDGALWFGTSGGVSRGVYPEERRDGKKFVNFTKKDGLAGSGVNVIYRDFDGMLWFGTIDGGVSCYDGVTWTSLDKRDGLAGNGVSSIYQDSDGSLWFGTVGGVTHYRRSTVPPKVHIVSVTTDKTYRDLDAIPSFTPKTRVTIAYSAIDFKTVPEKRQYRCRIIEIPPNPPFSKGGIDSDARSHPENRGWRKPTESTSFDYTFDKPGNYTFEVQAIDRDLNYSEPANVTLKVVQPFYLRVAFLVPTVSLGALLLAALVVQAVVLVKHRRQVLAYQRLAVQELQDANRVQMSLMPKTAPEIEGVEIAGKCIPANTVSGDFFDYLKGKNEIGLVVADVTGKAMKGAMNAVMADGVLRATAKAQEQLSPASLMSKLNDVLKVSMEWGMNITMVIATINTETKTLALANAAHHAYPLLLRNCEIQALKTGGLPLGMRAGVEYSEEEFTLQSGDVVILMTDGIIEAQACPRAKRRDSEEKLYSDSGRLEKTISQFPPDLSAEAMVNAVINDAINFGGDKTTRDDDMTVVVAKIK